MSDKYFWVTIIGMIVSFSGGFLLANSLNRNEISALQSQVEQAKKNPAPTSPTMPGSTNQAEPQLSDAEIKQKIAEADSAPENTIFQRDLGAALYRYGGMKQDPGLISESVRLLKRVVEKDPKDYDALVLTGNALFDIAAMRKDSTGYAAARDYYKKALEIRPNDPEVLADYGSTYFLGQPIEIEKARTELQKALAADSSNERALQFLTQVYIKTGNKAEAEKTFAKLKSVNPSNPMLPTLTTQIATGQVN
ncbi:MAG: tetratricopeptide repeat protein [Acidobacteria bacterium]|nr:tetratricopeptide repeat protein [Acidobacteriota bacterium]MBK8148199.1 tetratricopeptide repeat protein [Acidobacteriota bacterium]MBK8811783.1 tetratricopeptide repeat protein [Acidobacteriota bacterium]